MFKKCYLLLCYCCLQTRIAFERTGQRSDRYEVTWFRHGGWQRHVRHVECHGAQRGMWRVQGDRGTADNAAQHVIAIIRNWKPNSVSKVVATAKYDTTYHCSSSDWNRKRWPGPHQHTGVKWTHILMVRPQRFYSDWESWKYDTQTRQERRQGVQEGEYRSYGMYGPWQPPTRLRLRYRDQWPDRDKTFYGSLTQQNRQIFWWLCRANRNVNKLIQNKYSVIFSHLGSPEWGSVNKALPWARAGLLRPPGCVPGNQELLRHGELVAADVCEVELRCRNRGII